MSQIRPGTRLQVKQRDLPFSFFPVGRGTRRYGIADVQFATNPWAVMRRSVETSLSDELEIEEALAFLVQGEDFYKTAQGRSAAHPLLHYYAMLNVGKAILRVRGFSGSLEKAMHGITDRSANTANPSLATLRPFQPSADQVNVFPEILQSLGYPLPAVGKDYGVQDLMAQVVVGHRLWREGASEAERFIAVDEIEIMHDEAKSEIWLRMYVDWPTMKRHGMTQRRLVSESGLSQQFELVKDPSGPDGSLCLQQVQPVLYNHRPTDNVADLVDLVRPILWRIVSASPGGSYRRYYLYRAPPGTPRFSQLEANWALMYFLGSVVRYRPHRFSEISRSSFGPFIDEFISAQPEQLLYLFASEMCKREVARPAIVATGA